MCKQTLILFCYFATLCYGLNHTPVLNGDKDLAEEITSEVSTDEVGLDSELFSADGIDSGNGETRKAEFSAELTQYNRLLRGLFSPEEPRTQQKEALVYKPAWIDRHPETEDEGTPERQQVPPKEDVPEKDFTLVGVEFMPLEHHGERRIPPFSSLFFPSLEGVERPKAADTRKESGVKITTSTVIPDSRKVSSVTTTVIPDSRKVSSVTTTVMPDSPIVSGVTTTVIPDSPTVSGKTTTVMPDSQNSSAIASNSKVTNYDSTSHGKLMENNSNSALSGEGDPIEYISILPAIPIEGYRCVFTDSSSQNQRSMPEPILIPIDLYEKKQSLF
ncbi:hypothetical protein GE061_015716 [Apolygus lucorum]|uniref:Uncharacterized protein n=1 Tax=Apolygus lucorum TaxID=248454 RepID=A0A8S9XNU1_APOLU|nr:hypothetical protein GE061_015716 [Apolygus lucorum]